MGRIGRSGAMGFNPFCKIGEILWLKKDVVAKLRLKAERLLKSLLISVVNHVKIVRNS
tara:strand:- start:739 stop:912 length:174 start_codon:yes stop_codon:yes gene_type:complete